MFLIFLHFSYLNCTFALAGGGCKASVLSYQLMKKDMQQIVLSILFGLVAIAAQGQIKVEVSEPVELMCILSRTAEFQEYDGDMCGQYGKDADEWFAPYKQHAIIPYYQSLRAQHGIAHERVMSMALHLEIEKGKVQFIGDKSDLYGGWKDDDVDIDHFLVLLNQFYKETRFNEFFKKHRAFYEEGVKAYEEIVMPNFHQEWFAKFFGAEPTEPFHIVLCFSHASHNNAVTRHLPGKPTEKFAVCSYWIHPATGQLFGGGEIALGILVHEFNHSFVNPLLENTANATMMTKLGQKLMQFTHLSMERQSYNEWQIMINESIVRAAVIIYMQDYGFKQNVVLNEIFKEVWQNDFRWTPELVSSLRYYANHRDQYKTLNDFYPEIFQCLKKYLEDEVARLQKPLS